MPPQYALCHTMTNYNRTVINGAGKRNYNRTVIPPKRWGLSAPPRPKAPAVAHRVLMRSRGVLRTWALDSEAARLGANNSALLDGVLARFRIFHNQPVKGPLA